MWNSLKAVGAILERVIFLNMFSGGESKRVDWEAVVTLGLGQNDGH